MFRPALVALALLVPTLAATVGTATVPPPTFTNYVAPAELANDNNAGEPSVGVDWRNGDVFVQAYTTTYRVRFDGATPPAASWVEKTPPNSVINLDPILFTDSPHGRTYAGGLGPALCSILAYSDDDGETWVPMANPCAASDDHQTIGGGAWRSPKPALATFDRAVYYCAQAGVDQCATSWNGGLTFQPWVSVQGSCRSFHGHVKVGADGVAYTPSAFCGTRQGGFKTVNNGASWVSYEIPGSKVLDRGFDPSLAITPDNTVYEAWSDGTNDHPYVARSTDHGATWQRLTDLATTVPGGGLVASTFQSVVAGDNDRVAVAFLGTQVGSGNPYRGSFAGVWHLYVSYTYDGGLTWTTVKASNDIVQRGCIYDSLGSPSCHRNLLDFMDASLTSDGRVVVAYADGCISATCIGPSGTTASSSAAKATLALQTGGALLRGP